MTVQREVLLRSHIRRVVIEGLSNACKTSVLRAIKREQAKDEESERSVLILGEQYSQSLQGIDNEPVILTREEHQTLLMDRVRGVEELNDWAIRLGESASRRARGMFLFSSDFTSITDSPMIMTRHSLKAWRSDSQNLGPRAFFLLCRQNTSVNAWRSV